MTTTVAGDKRTKLPVERAASVWSGQNPVRRDEQVEFLKREGFLLMKGVLTQEELTELDAEVGRLVDNHRVLPHVREGIQLEPRQDELRSRPTFRKLGGVADLSDAFARLMRHPKIMDVLHDVMGPAIELHRDVVMMKPARVGREKPWHQDSVYWPWNPMDLVSAMTALDDAGPDNGCLQVIPRTHGREVQHFGEELQFDLSEEQQAETLYVPMQAGDTLLFHSLLMHASEPNTSDKDRRVTIFSYKTPGLKYIGKGEPTVCMPVSTLRPAANP